MKASVLIEQINNGNLDDILRSLYVDKALIPGQQKRYCLALHSFIDAFGDDDVSLFSSPGRSEVCGNHTDHQRGLCVAASINLDVVAVAKVRSDNVINILSDGYPLISVDCTSLKKISAEEGTTKALIKGVLKGILEQGGDIGGFDCYLTSNVIVGAGLSSSAAFENALGTVINHLFNNAKLDAIQIAKISKYSENVYFGKPCGLLDQLTSSIGSLIQIDFEDCDNPAVKKIAVDFSIFGYSLCIVDVKQSHADLTSDYAAILDDMHSVAAFWGKEYLRQIRPADFYANISHLRTACGDRAVLRALHFFKEEDNVLNLVQSLERGDFNGFLRIIKASGDSSFKNLQNIYSLTNPSLQSLSVALAFTEQFFEILSESLSGTLSKTTEFSSEFHPAKSVEQAISGVCRVHGGGFAGTIQVFVKDEYVNAYKDYIEKIFGHDSCYILKVRQTGSTKII